MCSNLQQSPTGKKIFISQDEELVNVQSELVMYTLYTKLALSNARDKYITTPHTGEDKLKFWRANLDFGFITGNSEQEN